MNNSVGKTFVLILQIGLTVLTAVFLCVAAGVWLNERFDTIWFMPPFLVLGIGGGVSGAWKLVKGYTKREKNRETETTDYINSLKAVGEKNRKKRTTEDDESHDSI